MTAGGSLLAPTQLDDREINMSKIAKEIILLVSLFLIAATVQFFAQSLPMALCFYFLPTLYSAYHFGRRHATLTSLACIFLVVLLDFLNNMMPGHRVLSLPGERLFNFAIWAGVLAVTGYVMGTLYERKQAMTTDIRESFSGLLLVLQHFMANEKLGVGENQRVVEVSTRMAEAMGLGSECGGGCREWLASRTTFSTRPPIGAAPKWLRVSASPGRPMRAPKPRETR